MRKLVILLVSFGLFFQSCTNEAEMNKVKAQRDSLQQRVNQKTDMMQKLIGSFNEIEANLETIKEKEEIINLSAKKDELPKNSIDKINTDILSIYDLMVKNKKKLNDLERKLSKTAGKNTELRKMFKVLKKRIEEKDYAISELKKDLKSKKIIISNLNSDINKLSDELDSLNSSNIQKTEQITQQDKALNTAFYAVGTKKELKKNQIITNKGGIIGIGSVKKLKENFNKDYFTEVDIRKVTEISLRTRKAKVITTHPPESYILVGDKTIEKLVIKDPEKFWSISKYLVIMIK